MRTRLRIAVIGISVLAIDVILGYPGLASRLPPERAAALGTWGMNLSWFAIPALFVFYPPTQTEERRFGLRIATAVLVSWYLTVVFRMSLHLPAIRQLARERGTQYDGIGLNAAVLVTGWIPPLLVTLVMISLLQFGRYVAKRRRSRQPFDQFIT